VSGDRETADYPVGFRLAAVPQGRGAQFRLAWDDERLPETLAGLHVLAFAILMVKRFITCMVGSA
jgi:hypothetical protein